MAWMTIEQTSEYLHISRETLYKYVQQGKIPVSKVGRHLRFDRATIDAWVKRHKTSGSPAHPAGGPSRMPARSSQGPMSVLIIDDDLSVRKLLSVWIAQAGHEPATAGTGSEALERLRHERFDLLFLDLYLPDMEGEEVIERIPANERPPVVLITGVPEGRALDDALRHQVVYALTKPFREEDVVRVLTMISHPA